ncbi:unnamed protein product [Ixodes persulcatus]
MKHSFYSFTSATAGLKIVFITIVARLLRTTFSRGSSSRARVTQKILRSRSGGTGRRVPGRRGNALYCSFKICRTVWVLPVLKNGQIFFQNFASDAKAYPLHTYTGFVTHVRTSFTTRHTMLAGRWLDFPFIPQIKVFHFPNLVY